MIAELFMVISKLMSLPAVCSLPFPLSLPQPCCTALSSHSLASSQQ